MRTSKAGVGLAKNKREVIVDLDESRFFMANERLLENILERGVKPVLKVLILRGSWRHTLRHRVGAPGSKLYSRAPENENNSGGDYH